MLLVIAVLHRYGCMAMPRGEGREPRTALDCPHGVVQVTTPKQGMHAYACITTGSTPPHSVLVCCCCIAVLWCAAVLPSTPQHSRPALQAAMHATQGCMPALHATHACITAHLHYSLAWLHACTACNTWLHVSTAGCMFAMHATLHFTSQLHGRHACLLACLHCMPHMDASQQATEPWTYKPKP